MEKNLQVVQKLLEDYNIDGKSSEKEAVMDFVMSFSQKLIKKCIEQKQDLSTVRKIKCEDIKSTYESMKMIRSRALAGKNEQRIKTLVQNSKMIALDDYKSKAISATTVKLFPNNELEHMMTNKQHQVTFQ